MKPAFKFFFDLAPLVLFMVGYRLAGMQVATILLMLMTLISLGVLYYCERKIAIAPLVTGLMVGVFGSLTLILHDDYFIKIKPTVVNSILGTILLVGAGCGKPLLKYVLEVAFQLPQKTWLTLSMRFGLFFFFLAALNEVIWRNFSTDFWISFKLFGMLALNILFWALHAPFIGRHQIQSATNTENS